jgi:hypothetical protein
LTPGTGERTPATVLDEMRTLFAHVPPAASQYTDISERNMFSPERRPWAPPPTEPPRDSSAEAEMSALSGPSGIRLYGTTISDEQKQALLYFERFSSRQKHRLATEGEIVRDEGERGETVYYQVVSVGRDRVELQDARGNDITVGLYDHQKTELPPSQPPPAVITQPRPTAQLQGQPQSEQQPQTSPEGATVAPDVPNSGLEPIRRMEDMPESTEEREQLVREGRLRRIDTPFGPVYRPVE